MAKKRGNGLGSVYKLKHKPLKKPYRVVVTVGYTDDGRAIKKSLGTYATEREASTVLARYINGGISVDHYNITFGEVYKLYIESIEKRGKKPSKAYAMIPLHAGAILEKPIKDLRPLHFEALLLSYVGANSSRLSFKVALSAVCNFAIENDFIIKNYVKAVKLPTAEKSTLHRSLTTDELRALWRHVDDKAARLALVYIYTGLRAQELLTLPLTDIHIKERYMCGGMKTRAGRGRIIPIADCIAPFISELKEEAIAQGVTTIGGLTCYTTVRVSIQALVKRLGLPCVRLHDFRYTCATLLSNYGVPQEIYKLILGHAQTGITEQVYIKKNLVQLLKAVNSLPHGDNMTLAPEEIASVKGCATGEPPPRI